MTPIAVGGGSRDMYLNVSSAPGTNRFRDGTFVAGNSVLDPAHIDPNTPAYDSEGRALRPLFMREAHLRVPLGQEHTWIGDLLHEFSESYLDAVTWIQNGIDSVGRTFFPNSWDTIKRVTKAVWDNPVFQLALCFVDPEDIFVLGSKLGRWFREGEWILKEKGLFAGLFVTLSEGSHDVYLMEKVATGEAAYVGRSMNWWTRTAIHMRRTIYGVAVQRGGVIARGLRYNEARALEELIFISNPHFLNRYHSINPARSDYSDLLDWARNYATSNGIRIFY
jgi:hypothetical protein